MTKEELEKEADKWLVNNLHSTEEDYKQAYLAGAEPREKRIAELEAQIEKMKADVRTNIKVADQNNNCLMYQKLNSMLNQWEGKRR